jgi:hypothetical protein
MICCEQSAGLGFWVERQLAMFNAVAIYLHVPAPLCGRIDSLLAVHAFLGGCHVRGRCYLARPLYNKCQVLQYVRSGS